MSASKNSYLFCYSAKRGRNQQAPGIKVRIVAGKEGVECERKESEIAEGGESQEELPHRRGRTKLFR